MELSSDKSVISSVWGDCVPGLAALTAAYLVMQLIVFLFKRHHRHKTFERMQINGPKPHFIHGHLYDTRRQPYVKFAHKMHEKYGKNVGIYLGGDPYLMTKDLDLIQQVFVARSRTFYDRMNFYLNVDPVPDNLICQRGDRWRYMRKILTPAFTNSKIRSSYFYRDTHQTVLKLMRQLEENSKNDLDLNGNNRQVTFVEDSYDRMAAVALDVIVKTAFHMDNVISFSGPLSNQQQNLKGKQSAKGFGKTDVFLNTVKRACRLAFNPLVELIFCFPFLDLPLTFLCNRLYFGSIINLLFKRLDYLVRRSEFPHEEVQGKPQQQKANNLAPDQRRRIIDSLIEVLRERKITKSEFTGNAFVIVFAGFETTANALTFTLWLLAKNQKVQKKLRKELNLQMEKVTQKIKHEVKPDEENQFDDKSRRRETNAPARADIELAELAFGCEYLEMVINESLRLYPPVPGLSCRQASVECTLSNGLHVEKGVNIIPSVFSIHRDKEIWGEEANKFKPERFEMLDLAQLNSAIFMPFGLGPRNCIGKAAAMHEMKIVIGRLILAYSIEACINDTPDKLKLCSPINITITNLEKIGLKFVKLQQSDLIGEDSSS